MSGCIVWLGRINNRGYGSWGRQLAHRRVWAAVNPEHLQPMTKGAHSALHRNPRSWWERQRAATHCKHAHEFTEENTYWSKAGKRHCRTCDRLRHRQYKAAKVAARGIVA